MDVQFKFPNLYPGTRTMIVLKQPKTDGSIRNVYIPETVANKLNTLFNLQREMKRELGEEGYMDYGLIICQANGRPIMTEHLNKRFKEILIEMNDPDIDTDDIVFHSIRHTSAGAKLRISNGDLKAVQGDGGWSTPDMVTKRYAHILDEDRQNLASEMEERFYQNKGKLTVPTEMSSEIKTENEDLNKLAAMITSNPELLMKVLESVQNANNC